MPEGLLPDSSQGHWGSASPWLSIDSSTRVLQRNGDNAVARAFTLLDFAGTSIEVMRSPGKTDVFRKLDLEFAGRILLAHPASTIYCPDTRHSAARDSFAERIYPAAFLLFRWASRIPPKEADSGPSRLPSAVNSLPTIGKDGESETTLLRLKWSRTGGLIVEALRGVRTLQVSARISHAHPVPPYRECWVATRSGLFLSGPTGWRFGRVTPGRSADLPGVLWHDARESSPARGMLTTHNPQSAKADGGLWSACIGRTRASLNTNT